jgi:hypothetical protein
MRCSILDGKKVKAMQKKGGFDVSAVHDGPIFRIMWGLGVDEDFADENIDYPFDPHTHSPPLIATGNSRNDALLKDAVSAKPATILPEAGMRVKVKFDKDRYFCGVVHSVGEPKTVTKGKKKQKQVDLEVRYEDGSEEPFTYPDPDLELMMPGNYIVSHRSRLCFLVKYLRAISLFLCSYYLYVIRYRDGTRTGWRTGTH